MPLTVVHRSPRALEMELQPFPDRLTSMTGSIEMMFRLNRFGSYHARVCRMKLNPINNLIVLIG